MDTAGETIAGRGRVVDTGQAGADRHSRYRSDMAVHFYTFHISFYIFVIESTISTENTRHFYCDIANARTVVSTGRCCSAPQPQLRNHP